MVFCFVIFDNRSYLARQITDTFVYVFVPTLFKTKRQMLCLKNVQSLGPERPGCEAWLRWAVWLWASYLPSLEFHFLILKTATPLSTWEGRVVSSLSYLGKFPRLNFVPTLWPTATPARAALSLVAATGAAGSFHLPPRAKVTLFLACWPSHRMGRQAPRGVGNFCSLERERLRL